jgi:hypothetical protein
MQTYRFEVRADEEAAFADNRAAWERALQFAKRLPDLEGRLRYRCGRDRDHRFAA